MYTQWLQVSFVVLPLSSWVGPLTQQVAGAILSLVLHGIPPGIRAAAMAAMAQTLLHP